MLTLTPIVGFGIAFLLSLAITPLVRQGALRWGALDKRSSRKIHQREVPRLGGIAIAISFFVPMLGLALRANLFSARVYEQPLRVGALLGGGFVIFLLGVYDDVFGATAAKKLMVQVPVAVFTWWAGLRIGNTASPLAHQLIFSPTISLGVTVLWLVGVMNAVNLIDGLDGLASGIVVLALATIVVGAWHREEAVLALVAICLVGGISGFLVHNFYPATIFMGDSGSLFLGYIVGAAAIWSSQKTATAVGMVLPIVTLALPLLDTSLAVGRRLVLGRPVFSADLDHIHHRLLGIGWSQRRSVLTLYTVSSAFCALSILMIYTRDTMHWPLMLAAVALAIGFARWLGYMHFKQRPEVVAVRHRNLHIREAVRTLEQRLCTCKSDDEIAQIIADFEASVSPRPRGSSTDARSPARSAS